MRLWHYKLFPYLPDAQFKGQLRELVAIMHDLKNNGKTNHLLINRVMDFTPRNLIGYFMLYNREYKYRYEKEISPKILDDFWELGVDLPIIVRPFEGWHCYEYLRVCMANLYEKHFFGIGKSRITTKEWETLCDGYEKITGERYEI